MSLPHPSPPPAEREGSEDPDSPPPPSKRPRQEEASGVSRAGWQPPRGPGVEPVWRWRPSSFPRLLARQTAGVAGVEGGWGPGVGGPARGVKIWNVAWQKNEFPFSSRSWGSGWRASGRPGEPGRREGEVFRVVRGDSSQAEARSPSTPAGLIHGVAHQTPKERDGVLKFPSSVRPPESPFLDVTSNEEEEENRCRVDGVMPSEWKENSISSSVLKISKSQNLPSLEIAKLSYFRGSITTSILEFPKDLNSNMSFVYLKEIAKKKNDKLEAYVWDFTNIYWCQNRPDVEKQEVQDDKKIVDAEYNFPDYFEGIPQSNSNQNALEKKKGLLSTIYHYSSIKCVRDSKKNSTVILANAHWKGAKRSWDSFIPVRLEKSQGWDSSVRHILKRNRQNCWIIESYKSNRENMKNTGEILNLPQLLELDFLHNDYPCTKLTNIQTQQSKPLMIGNVGNQKTLIKIVLLSGEGQKDTMLQLRYTMKNDFLLGNTLHSIIDDSMINWYGILRYERQINVKDKLVIARNMFMDIRNAILHKYLQAGVSDDLIDILKANIIFFLNTFDFLSRIENDSELQLIVHLNYPKNSIVGNHTVRILTFSRPLQNSLKPLLKKRKLSETKQVLEGPKKQNIDSISMTTKDKCLLIFEAYKKFPLPIYFDYAGENSLTNVFNFKITSCPEQHTNVESWACHSYTERKQDHDTVSHFNFKYIFENFFNIKQQAIPISQNTLHSEQNKTIAHMLNFENLPSEIEGKKYNFTFPKEVKVTASNLTKTLRVYKGIHLEKEEKDRFFPMGRICSVQAVSLMSEKVNVEETKFVSQNHRADKNEYKSIFRESKPANSKPFHLKTDSILCVNHQFETDSSEENNECFQASVVKCLSTEALTIAKDFEMKSKFDLVLEELCRFHEISNENEVLSTVEKHKSQGNYIGASNDVEEAKVERRKDLNIFAANKTCTVSLPCDKIASPTMLKRYQSLFKWKTAPGVREREVLSEYCYPRRSEKKILYSASEEACKPPLPNRHAFLPDECKEEKINDLLKEGRHFSQGIARVQPLKTCNRPIRIGLSRKARLAQLHPYLK
ncbi:PREDICTED: RAD51-associated protein 2 [Dipodomys ordii]|uniref:RAD51-associated protein 2 n=1 Tax=Dipodomys ordii TaxID=10020 RepID=A0A1S3EYM1_DIPOR|nr:PREDICTED: RAD51-associated protein 2 [Dipodomys ordii]